MNESNPLWKRKIHDDALDYAIATSLIAWGSILTLAASYTTSTLILGVLTVMCLLTSFTITPYLLANWLDTDIEQLVDKH